MMAKMCNKLWMVLRYDSLVTDACSLWPINTHPITSKLRNINLNGLMVIGHASNHRCLARPRRSWPWTRIGLFLDSGFQIRDTTVRFRVWSIIVWQTLSDFIKNCPSKFVSTLLNVGIFHSSDEVKIFIVYHRWFDVWRRRSHILSVHTCVYVKTIKSLVSRKTELCLLNLDSSQRENRIFRFNETHFPFTRRFVIIRN